MVRSDHVPYQGRPERPLVLVVDDDDSIRSMLVDILSYEGYRVVAARDGMEALAAIERDLPCVVLLDVLMPMLDGRSFANAVHENGISVPIVIMTASHAAARSREVQADAYVAKPFELPELLSIVERFRDLASYRPATATGGV
jgi:CheY-like chemotaxis protein